MAEEAERTMNSSLVRKYPKPPHHWNETTCVQKDQEKCKDVHKWKHALFVTPKHEEIRQSLSRNFLANRADAAFQSMIYNICLTYNYRLHFMHNIDAN